MSDQTIIPTPRGQIVLDNSDLGTTWRSDRKTTEDARTRTHKAIQYLGPWCPVCGKKGTRCKNAKTCVARWRKSALKGTDVKRLQGLSLPRPPMSWCEEKGYATTQHYSGGQWRKGTVPKLHSWVDRAGIAQEYAYEVATGRVEVTDG